MKEVAAMLTNTPRPVLCIFERGHPNSNMVVQAKRKQIRDGAKGVKSYDADSQKEAKEKEEKQEQEEAAVKIQAIQRGNSVRKDRFICF